MVEHYYIEKRQNNFPSNEVISSKEMTYSEEILCSEGMSFLKEPYLSKEALPIEPTDVMTGDRNRSRFLYYQLKTSIRRAKKIDIIVSFLMESGVKLILSDLKSALGRGAEIRLLTGNYLGITQPSALYLIKKDLGNQIDLRFYSQSGRSFHPKSYIFHYEDESEIYIGSSNISRSALTSGIEWNYRFSSLSDPKNFELFYATFEELFQNHSIVIDDAELKRYSKNWRRPAVAKDLERYELQEENADIDIENLNTDAGNIKLLFSPRGAQIEALYALENSRAEGAMKGLVHAATGIGKTYLAAFDSAQYEHVLFVAHREEILKQAAIAFRNVRQSEDYGFFYGKHKDTGKAVIFASVSTLGREEYLQEQYFPREYFDYVVIDEFHHAVTDQYRRIVDYFHPQFLLGLTATPERMDGRNIYEICDYNVPYELSLKAAINKGMLVPFHYYGIYDKTDYSGLHLVRGRYEEKDLNAVYLENEERYGLIYKYYRKYPSKRAMGFCCSKLHAERMAKEFCKRGISSVAVYSGTGSEISEDRAAAISKLRNREIKVIFSVDMFNEGLDLPELDMVMFLRPTESPVVFLQQLGRGLRKSRGKEYLNVLDFIGNYEKAGRTPLWLGGEVSPRQGREVSPEQGREGKAEEDSFQEIDYPEECIVDFDMRLIDLFREMEKKTLTVRERIKKEYDRVKELLYGKVPTRKELFTYMEDGIYQLCLKNAKENPFRGYLEFLYELDELSPEEELLYKGIGREFLNLLETTDMQKVYKMPVLYSLYNDGDVRMAVTETEVLQAWKDFFSYGTNWKDLRRDITCEEYQSITDRQHLGNIKRNPVRFLKASGKGFFIEKEGYAIALRKELEPVIGNQALKEHMKDILEYRTLDYYRRRYQERS